MTDIATRFWTAAQQLCAFNSRAALTVLLMSLPLQVFAYEICVVPLPFSERPDLRRNKLSPFSRAVSVPGFDQVFLDFGSNLEVHTISNGRVVPFTQPPLSKDNRAFPDILYLKGGDVLAFKMVTNSLFSLNSISRQFEEVALSEVGEIKAHTAY